MLGSCSHAGCRIGFCVSSKDPFAADGSQDSLCGRSALRRAGTDVVPSSGQLWALNI